VLILVGILPATYALNPNSKPADIAAIVQQAQTVQPILHKRAPARISGQEAVDNLSDFMKSKGVSTDYTFASLAGKNADIIAELNGKSNFEGLTRDQRKSFRTDIYLMSSSVDKLIKTKKVTDPTDVAELSKYSGLLQKETKYIPTWVKFAVAFALGLGTMIGWKRIVVTVGEKIGKEHLTYAQGASAEIVAMATIGLADKWGLPVSTTHVLSSGVAGTMFANRSGLQMNTLRNLLLAWVLTLPVCVLLGAAIFSFSFYILFHVLGVH
jgi:PiT family inorganic phosphate transporter